jgi:hypothetical protein
MILTWDPFMVFSSAPACIVDSMTNKFSVQWRSRNLQHHCSDKMTLPRYRPHPSQHSLACAPCAHQVQSQCREPILGNFQHLACGCLQRTSKKHPNVLLLPHELIHHVLQTPHLALWVIDPRPYLIQGHGGELICQLSPFQRNLDALHVCLLPYKDRVSQRAGSIGVEQPEQLAHLVIELGGAADLLREHRPLRVMLRLKRGDLVTEVGDLGVPLGEGLGEGFALDGPRGQRGLKLGDLDCDLVIAVLHLLARAVAVAAGGIDLGEEVVDDVVGALEGAVGDGGEASRVLLGGGERGRGGRRGGLGGDPLEAGGEHGGGGGCLGLERGDRAGGGGGLCLGGGGGVGLGRGERVRGGGGLRGELIALPEHVLREGLQAGEAGLSFREGGLGGAPLRAPR